MKTEFTKERISSIDILRGFALLGIILVNVLGFNASFFNFGGYYSALPDAAQQQFYNIYISLTADKFIFLFSFLYGYGIYMQYRKFRENKEPFGPFFSRRMMVLALFGILHVVLLWAGDILLLYALAGMVVFLLRKLPSGVLLLIAFFFYFLIALWLAAMNYIPLPDPLAYLCPECLDQAKTVYSEGNYFDILQLRLHEYAAFRHINLFYYVPKIIGVTLFGFVASKYLLHKSVASYKKTWGIILVFFVAAAVFMYLKHEEIFVVDEPNTLAAYMGGYELTNIFVAGTYLLAVLYLGSFVAVARILKPFALMGRMSLTNYLMQSLILGLIFYGCGFGYFGQTNVINVVLIAVAVYIIQISINLLWFRFYSSGPLEKLWRRISYGKLLPKKSIIPKTENFQK
ncbi:hypothetical protein SDC9_62681 [bioreactor metagenome]|uniref:PLD phosphodiesterase domain-containing protein n=1 Tax=bioreactor metagenome TaxID=1076179 RepID=A0A644XPX7_9ZZZZ